MTASGGRTRSPILVTGATGFVGPHLLALLRSAGRPIVAWGRRAGTSTLEHAPPAPDSGLADAWTDLDLLDAAGVRRALDDLQPTEIYHLAGAAHLGASWNAPDQALAVNVIGTHHLLAAARELLHPPRVLVAGSSAVYRPSAAMLDEGSPLGPTSPYGLSKLAQEMLARRCADLDRVPIVVTRSFNHTGPGQPADYAAPAFARQLAMIEAGMTEPVVRVGNLDARRDLTDVRDVVRAYRLLMASGQPNRPYNVCSGRALSMRELLEAMRGLARVRVEIDVDPARLRPSDHPVLLGSASRLRAEAGWQPEIPIERTLADLLAYWRAEVARSPSTNGHVR